MPRTRSSQLPDRNAQGRKILEQTKHESVPRSPRLGKIGHFEVSQSSSVIFEHPQLHVPGSG